MKFKSREAFHAHYERLMFAIADTARNVFESSDRNDLVLEYDVNRMQVKTYIYTQYLNNLSERSQAMLKVQYEEASAAGGFVLFLIDEENEVLKSYTI